MKQEFDLSKCRCKKEDGIIDESDYIYWEEDVKEFIRILLDTYEGTDENWIRKETIIKLAGKELK